MYMHEKTSRMAVYDSVCKLIVKYLIVWSILGAVCHYWHVYSRPHGSLNVHNSQLGYQLLLLLSATIDNCCAQWEYSI